MNVDSHCCFLCYHCQLACRTAPRMMRSIKPLRYWSALLFVWFQDSPVFGCWRFLVMLFWHVGGTKSSLGGWVRVCLPWGRWEIVFQNIAAFSLLLGIWRGSIFYAVRTQILRMCYKIITNIASLTSLGLQELLSLVQWLPVNFRIDYSITL